MPITMHIRFLIGTHRQLLLMFLGLVPS
eukprot:SAG11_NODE_15691_length_569_cov_1.027660_1_plen_27_part_10